MRLRKTYFCMKCKHLHCYDTAIGQKHVHFNDRNEVTLDKYGVIKL